MFDGDTLKDFMIQNWEMVLYFFGLGFFFLMVIIYPLAMVMGLVLRFMLPKVMEEQIID